MEIDNAISAALVAYCRPSDLADELEKRADALRLRAAQGA